jgi:hypothetical protein
LSAGCTGRLRASRVIHDSGGGGSGRRWQPAARDGSGTTARSRGREKAEEKTEKRLVSNLTPLQSSCGGLRRGRSGGAAVRQAAEARQWRAAEELSALGFFGRKAAAAAWGESARTRGHLNRGGREPWRAGPRPARGGPHRNRVRV